MQGVEPPEPARQLAMPALVEPPAETAPPDAPAREGLKLHGLLAGGAVIGFADGSQSFVRLGRSAAPGLILKEVAQDHALLAGSGGELRLGFADAAHGKDLAAVPATVAGASLASGAATIAYRVGLEPRRDDGRITGFAVRPGARLPLLEGAGLQAGDVILAVNGSGFNSEERVIELSNDLAGADEAEIEFIRNGRKVKKILPLAGRR